MTTKTCTSGQKTKDANVYMNEKQK